MVDKTPIKDTILEGCEILCLAGDLIDCPLTLVAQKECRERNQYEAGIEKGRQMERERIIVLLIERGYLLGEQVLETRKPTHGNCCTCQTCGQGHDECVCDHNELLQAIKGGKDV